MNTTPAMPPGKPSQRAQIAAGVGVASVVLNLFGCCCAPVAALGALLGAVAAILGFLEYGGVGAGTSPLESRTWAVVAMATGALGFVTGVLFFGLMMLGMVGQGGVLDQLRQGFNEP